LHLTRALVAFSTSAHHDTMAVVKGCVCGAQAFAFKVTCALDDAAAARRVKPTKEVIFMLS
jgi:hypothetical protein